MGRLLKTLLAITIALSVHQCELISPPDNINAGFFDDDVISISKYVLDSSNGFSMFAQVMEVAEMVYALNCYNPSGNNFTLFLPSNEAFNRFISESDEYDDFNDLLADRQYTVSLARYHVLMQELETNDFPYGALPDTTASGDYLTIGYSFGYDTITKETLYDSTVFKVNNVAPIVSANTKLVNGVVHVISRVLEPIVLSSYDWLLEEEGFSIISEAFLLTGLKDTMGIYTTSPEGELSENVYTLLIEHDSVFHKNGIYTIDDLIDNVVSDPSMNEYSDPVNPLYQFAAYHILENRYFLDALETSNYNTYANYPVNIVSEVDLEVNRGVRVYDTLISNADTTIIDYLTILYSVSNIQTRNGAIHFVNEMLEVFKPNPARITLDFLNEEPLLDEIRNEVGEHTFYDDVDFTALKWDGVNELVYVKSASESEEADNGDYISVDGDFSLFYTIPKVLAGSYDVILRANSQDYQNSIIQVFIDGNRIGGSFDLTSGGDPYERILIGKVSFSSSETHTIEVRSLLPGKFDWDYIRFDPSE